MTCLYSHLVVPIGGIIGGLIGWTDGGTIGHIVGGHIGGKSIELLHSGVISPFTHLHTQLPNEYVDINNKKVKIDNLIISHKFHMKYHHDHCFQQISCRDKVEHQIDQ